jgi:hypothetical protein
MLKEFAVEPAALANPSDCRAILDLFVMGNGAFISAFPGNWLRAVYECAQLHLADKRLRPKELKVIVEKLAELDKRLLLPSNREYLVGTDFTWTKNAIRSNQLKPFGGLIVSPDTELDDLDEIAVPADKVKPGHPLFEGLGQAEVRRNATDMAKAVALLVRNAKHIKFVEPNFRSGAAFEEPVRSILANVDRSNKSPLLVELYAMDEGEPNRPRNRDVQSTFEQLTSEIGAHGQVCFHEKSKVHNRFLLTERGGVFLGTGFDEKRIANDTRKTDADDWLVLKRSLYEEKWKQWSTSASRNGRSDSATLGSAN